MDGHAGSGARGRPPRVIGIDRPRIYALGEPHEAVWAIGWDDGGESHVTISTWGRSRAKHCVSPYSHHFITTDARACREMFDREVRPYMTKP